MSATDTSTTSEAVTWPTTDEYRDLAQLVAETQVELSNFVFRLMQLAGEDDNCLRPAGLPPVTYEQLGRIVELDLDLADSLRDSRAALKGLRRTRDALTMHVNRDGGAS